MTELQRGRVLWYLVFAVFLVSLMSGARWAIALGGLVLAIYSLAVVVNFRGLADALSARRDRLFPVAFGLIPEDRLPTVRTRFAAFAAIGAFVFAEAARLLG